MVTLIAMYLAAGIAIAIGARQAAVEDVDEAIDEMAKEHIEIDAALNYPWFRALARTIVLCAWSLFHVATWPMMVVIGFYEPTAKK